jgi:hypothetical protein
MAARNGQQMSDRRPSVDDAFNIFERAIGERLERWTRSDAFIDGVAAAAQANTVMRRLYDQGTGMLLHMWNLPTASDIVRLGARVAALERQLRDLSVRIEHDHRNCRYESGGD